MTKQEFYTILKERFKKVAVQNQLLEREVKIACRALSPEEAIGTTKRKDFPLLTGKDVMMQADFEGGTGQIFTTAPAVYEGTLEEILAMDIVENKYDRSIFIAAVNAVMRKLGLCDCSVHCKDDGPENCACKVADYILEHYGPAVKIGQVGYQPAILEHISGKFDVRILDLNPENVGQTRYGVKVLHGEDDYEDTIKWADLILCTGSTVGNGTIVDYMDLDKDVLFYGTSVAGTAPLMGLRRLCFAL